MAITATLVPGPMGVSGPNTSGSFAEEVWELTGDGAATTVTVTARWLRLIDFANGTNAANHVIDNVARSVALTFAVALASGAKVYLSINGRR